MGQFGEKYNIFPWFFSSARVKIPYADLAYYTGLDVIGSMFATHNPMLGEAMEPRLSYVILIGYGIL